MNTPKLDLQYLDSHTSTLLVIADVSYYPDGWSISTPTIEITPPGFPTVSIPFVAKSIQMYNAEVLEIQTGGCTANDLPDGIYKIKYSIYPAYQYYITKTILRTDKLLEKFDKAYLKLDILQCDLTFKTEQKKELDLIWAYIQGAIASANNCATKEASDLYQRAWDHLDKFLKDGKKCYM